MLFPLLIFSGFVAVFTFLILFLVHQSWISSHLQANYPSLWEKWVQETGVKSLRHHGGWYYKNGLYWEMFNFQIGDYRTLEDGKLNRMVRRSWTVLILAIGIWFPLMVGLMIATS